MDTMKRITVGAVAVALATLTACSTGGDSTLPLESTEGASTTPVESSAEVESSTEPLDESTPPEGALPTWGEEVASDDGEHIFTVAEPVKEQVENDDGDKVDGIRIDVAYTNESSELVDASMDIIVPSIVYSGDGEGEHAVCGDGDVNPWEMPVPAGRSFEWSSCYIVDDPDDVLYIIAPPDAGEPITFGLE